MVFCDVSKALDRVWHWGLILKLKSIGTECNLLFWFSSYLSDRKQRVCYNNAISTLMNISAGVPQGSIQEPVQFLIYINDIVNEINSKIRLFADDTSLYVVVDNPLTASKTLTCLKFIIGQKPGWSHLMQIKQNL
jgi:hypothetical protein